MHLQVAHGYLQHVAFVTGGEVDDYGAFVELEDLLEIYDLSLPANRDSESRLQQPVHVLQLHTPVAA